MWTRSGANKLIIYVSLNIVPEEFQYVWKLIDRMRFMWRLVWRSFKVVEARVEVMTLMTSLSESDVWAQCVEMNADIFHLFQ